MQEDYRSFKNALRSIENDKKYFFLRHYYQIIHICYFISVFCLIAASIYIFSTIKVKKEVEKKKTFDLCFIAEVSGRVTVTEKNSSSQVVPGTVLEGQITISSEVKSSCHIQIREGFFLRLLSESTAHLNIHRPYLREPSVTVSIEKGSAETISYKNSDTHKYTIVTPTAITYIYGEPVIVSVSSSKEYTTVSGSAVVVPKTIFRFPPTQLETSDELSTESIDQEMRQSLANLRLSLHTNETVYIPRYQHISENDFYLIQRLLNTARFDEMLQKMYFIKPQGIIR